jgi:hypothetical protein
LSSYYELPIEFLIQVNLTHFILHSIFFLLKFSLFFKVLTQRIGTIIKGFFDNQVLYTVEYINKNKSILAGHLEASVKPILVSQVIKDNELDDKTTFGNNMIFNLK